MRIFLSYASENRNQAEEIALALEGAGHEVFIDRADLSGGEDYHAVIRRQIEQVDLLVFLISRHSIEQGAYTLTELRMARDKWNHPQDHVLPVMLERTEMDAIPAYLRGVTIFQPEGDVAAELAAHLSRRRGSVRRIVPAAAAVVLAAVAGIVGLNFESWLGGTGDRREPFVSSVEPSDFVSRYVFPEGYVELTEYTVDPTAPFPADSENVVQLERIAFGYLEIPEPSGAFNIAVSLANTMERPIQLDITSRFFELADDQGSRAELVYFCCEARGELLESGGRRQFQLIYRSPAGWEGKEITTRLIHFRISGLLPVVRGVWSFQPLATAN